MRSGRPTIRRSAAVVHRADRRAAPGRWSAGTIVVPVDLRDAAGRPRATPGRTDVELVVDEPVALPDAPPAAGIVTHLDSDAPWVVGRAGMRYRDLIPGRLGGRYIASHIEIPDGGEVPDYVHFHDVVFQMIFCAAGWVRLVYEDQGEPFVLHAGDCVLQPPLIRHRVLEASPGLEVVEIGCPAEHLTRRDHARRAAHGRRRPSATSAGSASCTTSPPARPCAVARGRAALPATPASAQRRGLARVVVAGPPDSARAPTGSSRSTT